MATDYYGNEFLATDRIHSRYQEADAHRLANTIGKESRTRHSVLKDAGQALNRVIQAVLCKLFFSVRAGNHPSHNSPKWYLIPFAKRPSPCFESPADYH